MLKQDEHFKDRVAVITGGGGVLGRAMAMELAAKGYKIAILNRTLEKGLLVAEDIQKMGGQAIALPCDVLDPASVQRASEEVLAHYGHCNLLLNGAGGGHPEGNTTRETFQQRHLGDPDVKTIFDITPEGFGRVFDLNMMGTWLPIQAFGKHLAGMEGACIITISSMAATRPATKVPAYSASKAAVDNLTRWLAVHLAEAGIRVNAIAPGFFLTDQNRSLLVREDGGLTERSENIIRHTPMKRFGKPEDLTGTVVWLADERASGFVTGAVIPVDGGFLAYSGV